MILVSESRYEHDATLGGYHSEIKVMIRRSPIFLGTESVYLRMILDDSRDYRTLSVARIANPATRYFAVLDPPDNVVNLFLGTILHHNVHPLLDAIVEMDDTGDPEKREMQELVSEVIRKYA